MTLRIGQGFDVHRFGPGSGLVIGGVHIPYSKGLVAHSDGDVLLHAVCDALLGAAGLGDIGQHFPDSDPRWRDVDSRCLLKHVVNLVHHNMLHIINLDVTVIAQQPKLSAYKNAIRTNLAQDLQLDQACVNVKATTTETLGFTGRGEGIACLAIVLLEVNQQT